MRTTVSLPDDLHADLRRAAREDGRTMSDVVEEAVRQRLREREAAQGASEPYRITPLTGGGIRPGVDLSDSGALLDVMDGL